MNKICVYAIAKNEAQFVEQWVKNMSSADHIIVLDTGSTDNTVSLLTSLGVEVHETSYKHFRFDVARNDCLALIPDEYNIRVSIDLDELFTPDNWADIIRENWDEEKPRIVYNYVWAHNSNGSNGLQFTINKIHGRDPNLIWEGAVHEHLFYTDKQTRQFDEFVDLTDQITVHHYPDQTRDRLFYKDLARERIEEHPDDYQAITLLANEERAKGDPREAIKWYDHVIDNFSNICTTTELAAVYFARGDCFRKINDGVSAMISFSTGIAINKYYRDNYYGLGSLMLDNKMYEMAVGILEEGLRTSKRFYFWMEDNYTWTFALYDALGCAYYNLGNIDKALANATRALQYEPNNEILLKNYNIYLNT